MKKFRIVLALAAASALFAAQPALAAGQPFSVYSNVITAGQGNNSVGFTAPGSASGESGPGGPGNSMAPGSEMHMSAPGVSGGENHVSAPTVPGGENHASAPTMPGGENHTPAPTMSGGGSAPAPGGANSQQEIVPPGDEGTVLSPVIAAGDAGAAQRAAEEAARQQEAAEEAARQQAAQAAEEAARQQAAAEEAARQPAAQAGGRGIAPRRRGVAGPVDDGPQPSVGNRIMDCLAQYGGKATFFLVGDRVASRKTEVQRMVNEGHEVGNHTMNHKYLQKLGAAEIQSQVTKGNDAIEAACGVRPKLLRLPGGNNNATVRANTHMPMIQWNIDTLDWKTKNADKTVSAVLDHVKDGDIILMHELYSQSGDAALRIIPELHRRGYQMVTVSEMAAAKGVGLEAGKLYSSFR